MRIDNSYLSGPPQLPHSPEGRGEGIKATDEVGPMGETRAGNSTPSNLHVPSPELARFRSLADAYPDVRSEVMNRVRPLLHSGFYFSNEAASLTAAALADAVD